MATGDPLLVVHHGACGALAGRWTQLRAPWGFVHRCSLELFLGWVKPTPNPLIQISKYTEKSCKIIQP